MTTNNVGCLMDIDKFHKHMESKFTQWGAVACHLGDDFAVFSFEFVFKVKEVIINLQQYASYYGYRFKESERQVVIINTNS